MRKLFLMVALLAPVAATADGRSFGGRDCLDDCSGHAAGYRWAEKRGIERAEDCRGRSHSFVEGCEVFTQDRYRGADQDDDGNDIED